MTQRHPNFSSKELDALCRSIQVKGRLPENAVVALAALATLPSEINDEHDRGRALKYLNAALCGLDLMEMDASQEAEVRDLVLKRIGILHYSNLNYG